MNRLAEMRDIIREEYRINGLLLACVAILLCMCVLPGVLLLDVVCWIARKSRGGMKHKKGAQ